MNVVERQLADLFDLSLRFGSVATDVIKAGIEEHGLEPIQLFVPRSELPFMDGIDRFVEVALAVDDCDENYRLLAEEGILPSFTSPLPGPDMHEHLYARGFDGIPILACTDGENEAIMAPFRDLEVAPCPKVGVCTIAAEDIDSLASKFSRFFGMEWSETEPAGLGTRALVGRHRVKLIQHPEPDIARQILSPIVSAEMMFENHEEIRARLERAGHSVIRERTFRSGRKGWYFGRVISDLPITVFHPGDEREALGL